MRKISIPWGVLRIRRGVIPIALGMAFLLNFGGELQHIIFSQLSADRIGIYAAAYGDAIARIPSLQRWMLSGYFPIFFILSVICSSFALMKERYNEVFVRLSATTFALLLMGDLIAVGIGIVPVSTIGPDVFADGIGAVILSGILLFFIKLSKVIDHRIFEDIFGSGKSIPALIVTECFFLSLIIYYALWFSFEPLPVSVSMISGVPSSGYIRSIKSNTGREKIPDSLGSEKIVSSIIPTAAIKKSELEGLNISLDWKKKNPDNTYVLLRSDYANCIGYKIEDLPVSKPKIISTSLNRFVIKSDKQGSFVHVLSKDGLRYQYDPGDTFYRISNDGDKQFSITHFIPNATTPIHLSGNGEVKILLDSPFIVLSKDKEKFKKGSREINIKVNALDSHNYVYSQSRGLNSPRKCHQVSSEKRITEGMDKAILFTIKQSTDFSTALIGQDYSMTLSGHGSISLTNLPPETVSKRSIGRTDVFSAAESIQNLEIDGEAQTINQNTNAWLSGDLTVSFANPGQLAVSGTAKRI